MTLYSKEQREEIIKGYLGPGGDDEHPRCPNCGEVFQFSSDYGCARRALQIRVDCPECREGFSWQQPEEEKSWKSLHLEYFVERYRSGELIRCPVDDCYISYAEFSDQVVEFRCPYCNRCGRVDLGAELPVLE